MGTIAETIATCRAIGATCKRTPYGEFRVTLPGLAADRMEAIAGYVETAEEAIALAEHLTGKTAPHDWSIPCRLSGKILYRGGRPMGLPSRFTARAENATPDGSRMRARVEFPAQPDNGATCPRWSAARVMTLPAHIDESADRAAVRHVINYALAHHSRVTIEWDED